jgi:nucleotide-binding universal stress UspA family protein
MRAFNEILAATDFSPHAEQATCIAADLARQDGAALTVVHLYEPSARRMGSFSFRQRIGQAVCR